MYGAKYSKNTANTLEFHTANLTANHTAKSSKYGRDAFQLFHDCNGVPRRLKPPCGPDAEANRAHNEMILAEFAVWLSIKPNAETGKPIQHSSGYVSAVKSQLSQQARGSVLPERPMYLSVSDAQGHSGVAATRTPAQGAPGPRSGATAAHPDARAERQRAEQTAC